MPKQRTEDADIEAAPVTGANYGLGRDLISDTKAWCKVIEAVADVTVAAVFAEVGDAVCTIFKCGEPAAWWRPVGPTGCAGEAGTSEHVPVAVE